MSRAVDLEGATAVVTGAASGIGAALVDALVAGGATVYAADRDAAGLERYARTDRVRIAVVDVTELDQVEALIVQADAETGRLDLVFNNAGIVVGGDLALMDTQTWHRIVDVNLWGVVHGTQAAYRIMKARGRGHIVNTASSAGVLPVAHSTAYAATKHAVVGLSTSLRAEARGTGVRVSVVLPGVVETAIFSSATNLPGYDYQREMKRVPFRAITPAAAAAAILDGVQRNRQFIAFPTYNKVIIGLNRVLPGLMSAVINNHQEIP